MEAVRLQGAGSVTLAADVGGDASAQPVILLHGGGQTRHAWDLTAERLIAVGYRVLSLDQRGHGESDWAPDGDYTLDAFVADLRKVVDWVGGKPALVGASLGGQASLLIEAESPTRVASAVVLVDVTPRIEPEGALRIRDFMTAAPDGFSTLEEAADAVATYLPHRPRPRDVRGLEKNLRRHDDGRWRWHWDPLFVDAMREKLSSAVRERQLAAARALSVPTLLVRGGTSEIVSEESVAEFKALNPAAEVVDIPKAGHMVAGDRNDIFSAAVIEFLGRVLPVTTGG